MEEFQKKKVFLEILITIIPFPFWTLAMLYSMFIKGESVSDFSIIFFMSIGYHYLFLKMIGLI